MSEQNVTYFNLTVLTGIMSDPLISLFAEYRSTKSALSRTKFLHELYLRKAEGNFSDYVARTVLKDDNAFSRACAAGEGISPYLQRAYINDLVEIGKALNMDAPEFNMGSPSAPIRSWDDKAANLLYGYYQSAGFGKYISTNEFKYDREDGLLPLSLPAPELDNIKIYDRQRTIAYDNLENFAKGYPCSDMLLYGAAGMGKTNFVRGAASAFYSQKLRLVHLSADDIDCLPKISQELATLPLRFLILIDNVFLYGEYDHPVISMLKNGLEHPENVLIAVTMLGNLPTTPPEEDNELTENELLDYQSLNARFGISIPFASWTLKDFQEAVRELAKDIKLRLTSDELDALIMEWSKERGYSLCRAKQLVDYLSSCLKKGKEIKLP